MTLSPAHAIATVRAIAREHGVDAAVSVIADRSNLVLRLEPGGGGASPLVARVAMATSLARVGMTWLRREVELTRFLAERRVLVTRPCARFGPGPVERDGLVVSFWELETLVADRPDPAAAGAALRAAHEALASYPPARLPTWGGVDEAREVLARARASGFLDATELARIDRGWTRADAIVQSTPSRTRSFQAVHGDAHIGNVLATDRGAVWTDWEDAFVGPVEWDIASLRSKLDLFGEERGAIEAMTAAYGDFDADLARDLGLVRNLQVIAWLAVFAERHADLLPRMHARVARLPR